ncbi:capsule assembly Wzi family protein [Pseudoalteromonas phenolica]|uniref:capsule assembly Wzi family protein n=1 Tax=Pseudoalteromonas phenolica TaxID=161398 RepID=UPI00110ADA19|nr:capsule assembly Wzi family protein [Pseudoalteromonas phenolica]TMO57723.1 hypothetical protein CWC21_02500 [Pseudoalteromonas phenolica]
MKLKLFSTLFAAALGIAGQAMAAPTAYLPLGKHPVLEHQIDRMFAISTGTPMAKPYRIYDVQIALRQIKQSDPDLHAQILSGIKPYMSRDAVTRMGVKLRADSGAEIKLANDRSNSSSEYAEVSFDGIWRGGEHSLMQLGAEYRVEQGKLVAYNSFYALGGDNLQLNLGYKEHWFSPFKTFAQVYSNNAQAPLSVSLGLNAPLQNWWNFDFELFYSKLEHVEKGILYQDTLHSGTPKLAGTHLSIEPIEGWKIGANRMMQFGGGPRKVSTKDVFKAYFDPVGNDNSALTGGADNELGDQWASITSTIRTNWFTPIEWYFEHAGEDTKYHRNYQLGNTANSFGIFIPEMTDRLAFRYEYTKLNTFWYVNYIYPGIGNSFNGSVVGHFAADRRKFKDAIPSGIHSIEGDAFLAESHWKVKYSLIKNASNHINEFGGIGGKYETSHELQLINNRAYDDKRLETTLTLGKDVFGENYTWLAVNVYW